MRVVIDLQGAQTGSRFRGIGRYSLALAKEMARQADGKDLWICLNGAFLERVQNLRKEFDGLISPSRICVYDVPHPVAELLPSNRPRARIAELVREAFIADINPDVVHVSSLFEGWLDHAVTSIGTFTHNYTTAVTLYDLIPLLNQQSYLSSRAQMEWYNRKINSLQRSNVMLAISEYARREVVETLGVSSDNVINISSAVSDVIRPPQLSESARLAIYAHYNIVSPYLLYAGVFESRKNVDRLLEAFALLPTPLKQRHQLVLAGGAGEAERRHITRLAGRFGIENRIIMTGYIPDEDLVALYSGCALFVFPSLHEGFGLPALEAMTCGAATIGSNRTSIPEVIGRNDALFDPMDAQSMSIKIAHVLTDDGFRQQLREHATKQAANFSWSASAKRALEMFERCNELRPTSDRLGIFHRTRLSRYQLLIKKVAEIAGRQKEISNDDLVACANAIAVNRAEAKRTMSDTTDPQTCGGQFGLQLRVIFVDVSELVQRDAKSGIQRAVRFLLRELLMCPPMGFRVEPVYAIASQPGYRYARKFTSEFLGSYTLSPDADELTDEPIEPRAGDVFLGLDFQPEVVPSQRRYLDFISKAGVRVHFVVYDLLPILHDYAFPPDAKKAHERWLKTVTKFAGLVCISRAVGKECKDWLQANCPRDMSKVRITWFHLGANFANTVPNSQLAAGTLLIGDRLRSKPTFAMVGTLEPRKGHEQVLRAFEILWKSDVNVNLVIVGKSGWMVDHLIRQIEQHPENGSRLFWVGQISDDYLAHIYLCSTALIAASEGEGFGLPLIEAAQYNLPIIARDIPVFREVAGASAYYFSARDGVGLAQEIISWIELWKVGRVPTSSNLRWLTWRQSAEQLVTCLLGDDQAGQSSAGHEKPAKPAPGNLHGNSESALG